MEVEFWLEDLNAVNVNRKRGAAITAQIRWLKQLACATTRNKKYYRCNCEALYDDDNENEYCIGHDNGDCVGVTPDSEPDKYYCGNCFNNRMQPIHTFLTGHNMKRILFE